MVLTTHALTGAVIGKFIPSPWAIIPIALVAHFALDSLRHGEYVESFDSRVAFRNTWWKILLDLFLGGSIILAALYFGKPSPTLIFNILLGSFSSMFPDLLTLIYWKSKAPWLRPIYSFHSRMHRFPRHAPERIWNLRNAWNDILLSAAAVLALFLL